MSTNFTPEQIELLKANPYTADVNSRMLRHTLAFKQYALREYASGHKLSVIFEKAGYDPAILGSRRMSNTIKNFRTEAASPKGLRPSAAERKAAELRKKDKTINDLNKRIEQLEKEMDLLKISYLLKMKYLKKD